MFDRSNGNHISSPKSYPTCKYDGESFFPEHLEWNVPPSGNFVLGGSTRTCKTRPASSIRSFNSRSRLYQTSRVSRFRVEKRSKPKDGMMNSNARHCMYPLEYSKPVIFCFGNQPKETKHKPREYLDCRLISSFHSIYFNYLIYG